MSPVTTIAACKAEVLVPAPAHAPMASAKFTPGTNLIANSIKPSDSNTPITEAMLALMPKGLVKPLKNCAPNAMPTPYKNSSKPNVPSMARKADLGTSAPITKPTNFTPPAPSDKPRTLIMPTA